MEPFPRNAEERRYARDVCALVTALIGLIRPEVRRVSLASDDSRLEVCVFMDGEPSKDLADDMEDVETELICHNHPDRRVAVRLIRVDYPDEPTQGAGIYIYARHEVGTRDLRAV